jgi:hypothetical protein
LCQHIERKYMMFFTDHRTECPWQQQFYRIESRHIPWHQQCCGMWYKTRDVQCFLVAILLGGKAFWLDNYFLCPVCIYSLNSIGISCIETALVSVWSSSGILPKNGYSLNELKIWLIIIIQQIYIYLYILSDCIDSL